MWCAVCTPIFHCILSALVYTVPLVTAIQITATSKVYDQFGHHLVTLRGLSQRDVIIEILLVVQSDVSIHLLGHAQSDAASHAVTLRISQLEFTLISQCAV